MTLRVINRVIVLDQEASKILLVRNKGANFWYPPGGEWEHANEDIVRGARREVREEAGIKIVVTRLLYVQEFRPDDHTVHLEMFWYGTPVASRKVDVDDHHGIVEEARWFARSELISLKIFPTRLKRRFWDELGGLLMTPDPFLR